MGCLVKYRVFGPPTLFDVTTPRIAATPKALHGETAWVVTSPFTLLVLALPSKVPSSIILAVIIVDPTSTPTSATSTGPGRTPDGTPLRSLPRLSTPPTVKIEALVRSTPTLPTREEEEEGGARRMEESKGMRERRWPRKEIKD